MFIQAAPSVEDALFHKYDRTCSFNLKEDVLPLAITTVMTIAISYSWRSSEQSVAINNQASPISRFTLPSGERIPMFTPTLSLNHANRSWNLLPMNFLLNLDNFM